MSIVSNPMAAGSAATRPAQPAPAMPSAPRRLLLARYWALRLGLPTLLVAAVALGAARYEAKHPKPPVQYETALVDLGPIAAKVSATGAVSALVTVLVGSQVSGRIATLSVDFESPVKKGQTIATIEPSLLRAAVAQARANFASGNAGVETARTQRVLASRNDVRTKGLTAEGLASKADLDAADAALGAAVAQVEAAVAGAAQSKAALDQAELNLTYATIVSPIDGIVISRNVDVGQTVAAALQAPTLFTIAEDLTRMQVDTNVAESDVGKIKAGMPVTFTVEAYPQRVLHGTVRQIRDNAQTIQNVVTYDAVVDVDNSERLLKPGMTASVTFTYATRGDVLRLPNVGVRFKPDAATLAIMSRGLTLSAVSKQDERLVWILRGVTAVPETIRIGISDGSESELLAGDVQAGDRVVVEATLTSGAGGRLLCASVNPQLLSRDGAAPQATGRPEQRALACAHRSLELGLSRGPIAEPRSQASRHARARPRQRPISGPGQPAMVGLRVPGRSHV